MLLNILGYRKMQVNFGYIAFTKVTQLAQVDQCRIRSILPSFENWVDCPYSNQRD